MDPAFRRSAGSMYLKCSIPEKSKVSDSRRSLGLGLALCRSIVNAHGGELVLRDCAPHGCHFRFTLPLSEVNLNE